MTPPPPQGLPQRVYPNLPAQPVDFFDRELGGGLKKQHFFSSVRGAISDVSIESS